MGLERVEEPPVESTRGAQVNVVHDRQSNDVVNQMKGGTSGMPDGTLPNVSLTDSSRNPETTTKSSGQDGESKSCNWVAENIVAPISDWWNTKTEYAPQHLSGVNDSVTTRQKTTCDHKTGQLVTSTRETLNYRQDESMPR